MVLCVAPVATGKTDEFKCDMGRQCFLAKMRKAFIAGRTFGAMGVIEKAGLAEAARIETDKPDDAVEQLKGLQIQFKGAPKASRAITAVGMKLVMAKKTSRKPATTKSRSRPRTRPTDSEKKAKSRLGLARSYLTSGKKEKAGEILRSILADFPKTEAAAEARKLLGTQR